MEKSSNLLEEISRLSDSDLSDRLVESGFGRTPVTNMTRKYLEKQLIAKILQSEGRWKKRDSHEGPLNGINDCQHTPVEDARLDFGYTFDRESHILSTSNSTMADTASIFYAVYCPTDNSEIGSRLFYEQEDALKYAKKNKRSRFKAFKTYDEAVNFATHGVNGNGSTTSPVTTNQSNLSAANMDGASRFKGPKSQDLVQLRKAIESGNVSQVRRMVWENPRYLVSSGDTPSILQEGARYNALHIAAKVLNAEMTSLLLETVSDMKFIQLLYGIESEDNCRQRAIFLLDLYLNTPDKSLNETPLHLAVKFGAVAVVQVLVSYPECDKTRPNKFALTPHEIICSRVNNPKKDVKDEIEQLLRDAFFVPVLRSMDAVLQPQVGELFSCKKPLVTNNDPLSPHMDVSAYAGPMDFEQAQNFRRCWKTPPRIKASMALRVARLNDLERGLEREGRNLARQFNIKWKEYWSFLGIYTDFSTLEGLNKLEEFLTEKFVKMSEELAAATAPNESSDPHTSSEQTTATSPANGGSQILSPMSRLCVALNSCTLEDRSPPDTPRPSPINRGSTSTQAESATSLSPIMYIEKTCQVLARRLADGIFNAFQASEEYTHLSKTLKDVLHAEVSNMQKLIISFKANSYFTNVNFQLMHSRIAMLIPFYLDEAAQSYDLMVICSSLQVLASKCNDDSSEDESEKAASYRGLARAAPLRLGEQMACLAQLVIHALNRPGGGSLGVADLEEEVMALWARGTECACTWSASPPMPRNMRRGASLKRGLARQTDAVRVWTRDEAKQVVQRIPSVELDDDQSETSESEETPRTAGDGVSVGDETDTFYTPPSSVTSEDADMEEFDTPDEGMPVFLDGKLPTKLDMDVLRALDQELLSSDQYPSIWRWRHELMQYPEHERECWPSPMHGRQTFSSSSPPTTPVSSSALSPIKSPLVHRKPNSMQQMWGSPEPPFTTPPKRRLNL